MPYQALLHAIWTDERFSSVCVSMRNTDQIRENAAAARLFQPLTKSRDRPPARCLHRRRADDVCLMRRPVQPGRRHAGRAGQPDQVPHLPRPSRLPRRSSAALCRARRRRAQTGRVRTSRLPARPAPTSSTSPGCSRGPRIASAEPALAIAPGGLNFSTDPLLVCSWCGRRGESQRLPHVRSCSHGLHQAVQTESRRLRWVLPQG